MATENHLSPAEEQRKCHFVLFIPRCEKSKFVSWEKWFFGFLRALFSYCFPDTEINHSAIIVGYVLTTGLDFGHVVGSTEPISARIRSRRSPRKFGRHRSHHHVSFRLVFQRQQLERLAGPIYFRRTWQASASIDDILTRTPRDSKVNYRPCWSSRRMETTPTKIFISAGDLKKYHCKLFLPTKYLKLKNESIDCCIEKVK